MGTTNGVTYMTFEHPVDGNEYEIQVCWRHHYSPAVMYLSNGDPGYPEESETDWTVELTAIDGEPVTAGTEVPEWITSEMIEQEIDLSNCYNDYDD